ncbi:hypothetical protein [Stigmatella aurantiaca]|uniref:Conserved uncharacterized protein n=1 Tax=Stigmatella aurantiaca (strain DW4/3-1) TaxID=378806 RepID=Q08PM4_STIAD|nr:hypothetical protein [Stigmatella aurantiaca]ADO71375.1 conserved uncharacterized protein [Stigmatella aurantiaca DW4/3-1]EAU62432.1 hypothetical protein STIAU_4982 [Stigmatella aurantiaca DW4/3-1]
MTPEEAKQVLENTDVVPCMETSLPDARGLVDACLSEGLPALVSREACSKPGCSPKFQVLVRREDAPRVAGLLQQRWLESIRREGLPAAVGPLSALSEEGEPPCPACGTAAPLAEGACSDCGLQLE